MNKLNVGDEVVVNEEWFNDHYGKGNPYDFSGHPLKPNITYKIKKVCNGFNNTQFVYLEGNDNDCWFPECFKAYEHSIELENIPSNLSFWQAEVEKLEGDYNSAKNPTKKNLIANYLISAQLRLKQVLNEKEFSLDS